MREELGDEMLELVSGGRYVINRNTNQIGFRDAQKIFKLKNCTFSEAQAVCDSFIGKYATEVDYDNACIAALRSKGWI